MLSGLLLSDLYLYSELRTSKFDYNPCKPCSIQQNTLFFLQQRVTECNGYLHHYTNCISYFYHFLNKQV